MRSTSITEYIPREKKKRPLKITFVFASPLIKQDKVNPVAEQALSILDEFEGVREVLQEANNKDKAEIK
jgi:hypothetical protein